MIGQKQYTKQNDLLDDNRYLMHTKVPGWYCLGGVGYSLAGIKKERARTHFFPKGFNVSSALGYLHTGYSFEAGSYIDVFEADNIDARSFSWASVDPELGMASETDLLIWNTTFYLGIKAAIPGIRANNHFNPFLKVFVGRGVSVLFWEHEQAQNKNATSDKRFHLEGYSFGLSLSNIHNMFNHDTPWYWELTLSRQANSEYFYVAESGELPTELANDYVRDQTLGYLVRFTIGARFF